MFPNHFSEHNSTPVWHEFQSDPTKSWIVWISELSDLYRTLPTSRELTIAVRAREWIQSRNAVFGSVARVSTICIQVPSTIYERRPLKAHAYECIWDACGCNDRTERCCVCVNNSSADLHPVIWLTSLDTHHHWTHNNSIYCYRRKMLYLVISAWVNSDLVDIIRLFDWLMFIVRANNWILHSFSR